MIGLPGIVKTVRAVIEFIRESEPDRLELTFLVEFDVVEAIANRIGSGSSNTIPKIAHQIHEDRTRWLF